ncbi:hypothetical protein VM1G_03125 [Cytospora mali]|uniref:Cyclochlorotine biosynthesis protein O n=1 Tax=Cytospora mali TaxID=578113 RepID=A0A194VUL1_CYTMA|nr:hypothetical protein VM1G_03125 [Valsa mali]
MTSTETCEKIPFLGKDEDGMDGVDYPPRRGVFPPGRLKWHGALFIVQLALLTLNLTLFWQNTTASHDEHDASLGDVFESAFSPVRTAVQFKVEEPNPAPMPNPFFGEPRPEVDQAWSDLLRGSMVRISEDEMRKMNKTSIALRDRSGYIGYLESIHMLHCVKRIYQFQHPEHYPNLQGTDAFSPAHWDHCLDVLQRGIMCNADVTVNTYFWKTSDEIKGDSSGSRVCTDWDRIQKWTDERAVKYVGNDDLLSLLVPIDDADSIGPEKM